MCHNQQQNKVYSNHSSDPNEYNQGQYNDYYGYRPQFYRPVDETTPKHGSVGSPMANNPMHGGGVQEEEEDRTPPLPPEPEDDNMELDSPTTDQSTVPPPAQSTNAPAQPSSLPRPHSPSLALDRQGDDRSGTSTAHTDSHTGNDSQQPPSQYLHQDQWPANYRQENYQYHGTVPPTQPAPYSQLPLQPYHHHNRHDRHGMHHQPHGGTAYPYYGYYPPYNLPPPMPPLPQQPHGYYQHQHQQQPYQQDQYQRWNQQQYSTAIPSQSSQQQQQRIVRTEQTNTSPPSPSSSSLPTPHSGSDSTTSGGPQPPWSQPKYPQWEGGSGHSTVPGVSQYPPPPTGSSLRGAMRGRGRGTRGARGRGSRGRGWAETTAAPGRYSRWDTGSDEADRTSGSSKRDENQSAIATTGSESTSKGIEISKDPSRWPPKLKKYLMRSFESCKSDADRDHVEQYLKVEITAMFEDKRVWQIDWDEEPLPLEKIKRQGQKRKSRWDTPSPTADLRTSMYKRFSPPAAPSGNIQSRLGTAGDGNNYGEFPGRGRGRGGRGKKKQWGQGKKGKFFIDHSGSSSPSYVISDDDKVKVNLRSQRFARGSEGNQVFKPRMSIEQLMKTVNVSGDEDWKDYTIEGTSQELEKRYLRLTSAPDPTTVRPERVLVKSMEYVLSEWTNNAKKEYRYVCEQFKSIRQDLTIQGIRNRFSVEVYETHGRIALQNGDWSEFNQCQSQLRSLYKEGIQGHRAEFMSYRILYHMMTNETADLGQILTELTGDLVTDPAVGHALKLRKAWSFGNYYRFFQLYPSTPHCGRYLVDLFIERQKKNALKTLSKAYVHYTNKLNVRE